jgi:PhnB protein
MIKFAPYLYFNGNCREAMTFYKKCLGGELKLMTVGETPSGSQMPAAQKDKIMHSTLEKDNIFIMASDWLLPTEKPVKGNTINLCVTSSTGKQEIEGIFSKLSKDGKVTYPLKEEFFGTYGAFTDKFGVNWMFQADKPKA